MAEQRNSVQKSVSITPEQNLWCEEHHISLSALLQDAIEREIAKYGVQEVPQ